MRYSVNQQTSAVTKCTYDHGNGLKTVTPSSGTTYSYTYDNHGNATAKAGSLAYNTANQITTSGWGYDHDGNITADPANGTLADNDASQPPPPAPPPAAAPRPSPTSGNVPSPADNEEPPSRVLDFGGGVGSTHRGDSRWWTWPLPPNGRMDFICQLVAAETRVSKTRN